MDFDKFPSKFIFAQQIDKMNKEQILDWFLGKIARDNGFAIGYVIETPELHEESKTAIFEVLKRKDKQELIDGISDIAKMRHFPKTVLNNLSNEALASIALTNYYFDTDSINSLLSGEEEEPIYVGIFLEYIPTLSTRELRKLAKEVEAF